MEPKNRSGISYWASAWLMGLVGLLTAALWPQAWAQTPLVERGEGSARGWWADQATLEARMNFERAMARLETDAWARERGRFLRSLRSSDDLVLKSLGEDLDDLDMATAPEVPPSVVESIVDWAVGRRMPSEYEVRQMVQERLNGTSAFVSMRMNGLNLAVGIPISS
jgi:hypothetical protein